MTLATEMKPTLESVELTVSMVLVAVAVELAVVQDFEMTNCSCTRSSAIVTRDYSYLHVGLFRTRYQQLNI